MFCSLCASHTHTPPGVGHPPPPLSMPLQTRQQVISVSLSLLQQRIPLACKYFKFQNAQLLFTQEIQLFWVPTSVECTGVLLCSWSTAPGGGVMSAGRGQQPRSHSIPRKPEEVEVRIVRGHPCILYLQNCLGAHGYEYHSGESFINLELQPFQTNNTHLQFRWWWSQVLRHSYQWFCQLGYHPAVGDIPHATPCTHPEQYMAAM